LRQREAIEPRQVRCHREFFEALAVAQCRLAQPVMLERHRIERRAENSVAIEVAVTKAGPVPEHRSEAECCSRGAHQGGLVDSEQP
jgi:hypothetical protein